MKATIETGMGVHVVFIDPFNRYAYVSNIYGNNVSVLDLTQQKIVATVPSGAGPNGIGFSPLAVVTPPAKEIMLPVMDGSAERMLGMMP